MKRENFKEFHNWRRQIVNIKKLINTTIKNSKQK